MTINSNKVVFIKKGFLFGACHISLIGILGLFSIYFNFHNFGEWAALVAFAIMAPFYFWLFKTFNATKFFFILFLPVYLILTLPGQFLGLQYILSAIHTTIYMDAVLQNNEVLLTVYNFPAIILTNIGVFVAICMVALSGNPCSSKMGRI